ncbi:MAG: TonB-dependent receptor [Flavobacterium sp.]|nr:MAG: TonB-dependent receptor [Flavobacterium sp.]
MKKCILIWAAMLFICVVQAQNTFNAYILDSETKEALIGANCKIDSLNLFTSADETGLITFKDVPEGTYQVEFSIVGYEERRLILSFPLTEVEPLEILLNSESDELEEVVITSTRSTRTIRNIPTRVEFISGEELEEKANMKPGDIRLLLSESTGIQTQQTSATSANSSIRIQGLDGRYTQILKDGFPLYSGASSGLGLLQTPPLDLKQVEIIKGSASTLYGGGAIAGLVNLISKTPTEERELRFHLNGTSALGLDINGFYSQKFEKVGLTLFASHNSNAPYDPSDTGLTAIPKFERYNLNPKLFIYFSESTTLDFGVNTAFETRTGGNLEFIKGDRQTGYFERNKTERVSTQFNFIHNITENSRITIRNSYNNFNRDITIPDYLFNGLQNSTFSEITYSHNGEVSDWITGVNLWTDDFSERPISSFPVRDYNQTTYGAFIQNTLKATEWLSLESGVRGDYVIDYGFAFLPRVSALLTFSEKFSSRLGGGLGYKAPTIFTEDSERIQYQNVLPINSDINKLETSYGANFDLNYRTTIGDEVSFSINQLFFYTYLNDPLLLSALPDATYRFVNADGYIDTKGAETNIKIGYEDFKLFIGYSYTDARISEGGITSINPLTARHRINNVLMYEIEDRWKVGLEAYYFSPQKLNDGTTGRDYWITGFMAEKLWEHFSVYINFENFTDTRQTRFDSIYSGSIDSPVFRDIYAPLDGFVVNAGLKIRL